MANYKLLAMLFVALGGYSGLNLYKDVESYRAKPTEAPVGNQSVPIKPIEEHSHPLESHSHPVGEHSHPEQSAKAAIQAHIERDHIKDHRDLHQ